MVTSQRSCFHWGFNAQAVARLTLCLMPFAVSGVENISSIDSGGRSTSSANYRMDGCIGGIGGVSGGAAPAEKIKHGYIGQLFEVTNVVVSATPAIINEGTGSQLGGWVTFDDGSIGWIAGSRMSWTPPSYPLGAISAAGVATASSVYTNSIATVWGYWHGTTGSGTLLVLDSDPDNYGSYAGDSLPDWWQNQFFGLNNPSASPGSDPDADGQNNLFEYTAGLVPTNATSRFLLHIEKVTGQASQKKLIFSPRWADRTYTPQYRTNLTTGSFQALTSTLTSDNGTERTVSDTNATERTKFYRVQISLP